MIGITILLAAASLGFGIARWLRVPAVPLLLLIGAGLGAVGLRPPEEQLENGLVLGLTFLVFVAGIELNPRRVATQRATAVRVGVVQFILLGAAGLAASRLLGYEWQSAWYLALALTASSTLVVLRLLQQRRQMFEPFGRLVIGVLLVQDLLVILLIPVLTRMGAGAEEVLMGFAGILLLGLLSYVCLRWVAPFLVQRASNDEETLLLSVLALLFVFVGIALVMGLPVAAGGFLAGVSLSGFPTNGLLRGQLNSLSDFFLAIFFTALGALIQAPSSELWLHALVLSVLVVLITPPLVVVLAERAGLSARQAIESGLLLAQTSELSLIVGLQGWSEGQISADVFSLIVLVTVATMIATPFIASGRMTWWLMRLHPAPHEPLFHEPPHDHILLLGCGDNGMPLLETLLGTGHEVLVVDDDPAVIARLRTGEVPCIRGDGSDFEVLRTARARAARLVISTMRRPRDSQHVLNYVRGRVPVLVRVFEPDDAAQIRELGGTPVLYSEAAVEDFLLWMEQAEEVGLAGERRLRPRYE